MANASRGKPSGGAYPFALRVLALMLGLFFVFNAVDKIAWIMDSGILAERLRGWLEGAPPPTRWYIETVAMPGVPLFARLVPIAELASGAALVLGVWTRLAAVFAFLMVTNVNFARGMFHNGEILTDGVGLPVMGALLALAIAGRLPLSLSK
jgi:uncharacterized membrane protein YphA (DoxX/SURF4 family)